VLTVVATSDLQEIAPLVWVMFFMGVAGASVTFAYLVYALWKFRDPATRRRRYG
jgi:hypothetical protein